MRARERIGGFALVTLACTLLAASLASPSGADQTTVMRFKTDGFAFANFGACPEVDPLPPGTVCRETQLAVFREGVGIDGGGIAPPKTPWVVNSFTYTVTIDGNGDGTLSNEVFGFRLLDPSAVTYDREHLAFASLQTQIPMSDGTSADVDFQWRAISDRSVYGNNGPALGDFGLVRKFVDRCSTAVNQGHQKYRVASMTGTWNGSPVHSYSHSIPPSFRSTTSFS